MSERVYVEARGLEADQAATRKQFENDKAQILAKSAQLEEFYKSLGSMTQDILTGFKNFDGIFEKIDAQKNSKM